MQSVIAVDHILMIESNAITLQKAVYRILVLVSLLSTIAIVLVGCSNSDSKAANVRAATTQSVPVSVTPVKQQNMPVYLVGLGIGLLRLRRLA